MTSTNFKAVSLCNEINLNKLANHFGIKKKFEWEDSLRLGPDELKGVLRENDGKYVYIFAFGCGVFINLQHHEIVDIVNYLKNIETRLTAAIDEFADDYKLIVDSEGVFGQDEESYTNDSLIVTEYAHYQMEILSVVLAKSVALERIEMDIEVLLDEIEPVMDYLKRGRLGTRDQKIANISSRILRFKYNTISSIMLLDKPDITWNNSKAEELYRDMAHIFELDDRYSKVRMKAETLMDIVQVFSSLTQHKKASTLEWMIIVLIVIEIVISLVDFYMFKLGYR
jgi:required for meiotic nuclear division protein 1